MFLPLEVELSSLLESLALSEGSGLGLGLDGGVSSIKSCCRASTASCTAGSCLVTAGGGSSCSFLGMLLIRLDLRVGCGVTVGMTASTASTQQSTATVDSCGVRCVRIKKIEISQFSDAPQI